MSTHKPCRPRCFWRWMGLLILTGVVVGLAVWRFWPKGRPGVDPQLLALVKDLHTQKSWIYRVIDRQVLQARRKGTIHWIPQFVINKAGPQSLKVFGRQDAAKSKLIQKGTNAWPVLPDLVQSLESKTPGAGGCAALVLAGIEADKHPDFSHLVANLRHKDQPVILFGWLLSGDQISGDFPKRTIIFALRALAVCGPAGRPAIPKIRKWAHPSRDQDMRCEALASLGAVATNDPMLATELKQLVQDQNEWPEVRGTALQILARVDSNRQEVLSLLRQALNEERSWVRLKAAESLWQITSEPGMALPVLTNGLIHKLANVRLESLRILAGMKLAAQPAIPRVVTLLSDTNPAIRFEATNTLRKITPTS